MGAEWPIVDERPNEGEWRGWRRDRCTIATCKVKYGSICVLPVVEYWEVALPEEDEAADEGENADEDADIDADEYGGTDAERDDEEVKNDDEVEENFRE